MQLRYDSGHTGEQYVKRQAWGDASLPVCPHHPLGNCSLARHGTYARKTPSGTRVARWYCPESHTTFSLLPDCLAARLPGTLAELEQVVATAEAAASLEAVIGLLRPDPIELPGALRWVRRRIALVHRCLSTAMGMFPELLSGCATEITSLRERLGEQVLLSLRQLSTPQLSALPSPVGFYPHWRRPVNPSAPSQQRTGPDPPA